MIRTSHARPRSSSRRRVAGRAAFRRRCTHMRLYGYAVGSSTEVGRENHLVEVLSRLKEEEAVEDPAGDLDHGTAVGDEEVVVSCPDKTENRPRNLLALEPPGL